MWKLCTWKKRNSTDWHCWYGKLYWEHLFPSLRDCLERTTDVNATCFEGDTRRNRLRADKHSPNDRHVSAISASRLGTMVETGVKTTPLFTTCGGARWQHTPQRSRRQLAEPCRISDKRPRHLTKGFGQLIKRRWRHRSLERFPQIPSGTVTITSQSRPLRIQRTFV